MLGYIRKIIGLIMRTNSELRIYNRLKLMEEGKVNENYRNDK